MENIIVSDSPHIRSPRTTKGIMLDVLIALIPAVIMGCVYFGYKAAIVLGISMASAVATEFIWLLCKKTKPKYILKQFDYTSLVTGLLLGLTLSSSMPWYVPMFASVFAIGIVKMLFGGTGKNIVNPAITGRIFAVISFQSIMIGGWLNTAIAPIDGNVITGGATVLTEMLNNGKSAIYLSNLDLFLGTGVMGCIGETSKLALLLGGVYLVVRKVIDWKWPTIYILVTGLMTVFLNKFDFAYFLPSILSGGLFIGAIFMATDYVTSPHTKAARYAYYISIGLLTAILRKATHMEVVSFAILLMNLIVPLFDQWFRPRPFGSTPLRERIQQKFINKGGKSNESK
ncbi:MAG: RnfABCDGE type electron transport complex subunit D [Clostridia bacterium]